MTPLEFFLPCIPPSSSHHAKRIVRIGKWTRLADKPELVAAKETLDGLLVPFRPASPFTGPVALTLRYTWPWRASASKKVRAGGPRPRTTRPDCSNLAKTLEDRLVRLRFIADDALVCRLVVEKWWGSEAGIGVRVESVEPWWG